MHTTLKTLKSSFHRAEHVGKQSLTKMRALKHFDHLESGVALLHVSTQTHKLREVHLSADASAVDNKERIFGFITLLTNVGAWLPPLNPHEESVRETSKNKASHSN